MTATQSPLSPSSASERRTDPSMEEILASIRKIIADDEAPAPRPSPMPAAPRLRDAEEPRPAAVVTPITPGASRPAGHSSFGHSSFGLPRPTLEPFLAAKEPTPARESTADEPVKPEATYGQATEATVAPVAQEQPSASASSADPSAGVLAASRTAGAGPVESGALVSAATTDSIASAFEVLTTSVALTTHETVDRHVREILRPMLRTWLDDNLPVIVEKLVRSEIERVARGGR